jgi:hypothetical protein
MKIEFLPGIWISDSKKLDNNFISDKCITNIINIDKNLDFLGKSQQYNDTIRENIEKYENLKMVNYLKDITLFMKNTTLKSENILIYSDSGLQKGPVLLLAYLIRYGFLNKEIAIQIIRTKIINAFKPSFDYEKPINIFIKQIEK